MTIRIVTDSTCDLPTDIISRYNITVVPSYINVGDRSMLDGVDVTHTQFYNDLPSYEAHPTTAAPSPQIFADTYLKLKAEGATEIISIHISSDLSLFFNAARLGSMEVTHDIPVSTVDSRNVSMGLGLLVVSAARAIQDGLTVDETIAKLNKQIPHTRVYAAVDTLEFLRRSGRVGWGSAGIGTLLKLKPILEVKDGAATSFDRVRTSKKVPAKLMSLLEGMGPLEELAVVHGNAITRAQALVAQFDHLYPTGSERIISTVGPAVGAHAGPGVIGFACIAKG